MSTDTSESHHPRIPPSQDLAFQGEVEKTIEWLEQQAYQLHLQTEENKRQWRLAHMRKDLETLVGDLRTWNATEFSQHRKKRFQSNLRKLGGGGFTYELISEVLFIDLRPDLALVLLMFLNSFNCEPIADNRARFLVFVIKTYRPGSISVKPRLAQSLTGIVREVCPFEYLKALFNDWLEGDQSGAPIPTLCSTSQDRTPQVRIFRVETFFPQLSSVVQDLQSRDIQNADVVLWCLQQEIQHSGPDGFVRETRRPGEDDLTIDLPATRVRVVLPEPSANPQEAKIYEVKTVWFYLQSMLAALTDLGIVLPSTLERLIQEETRGHPQPVTAMVAEPELLPLPVILLPQGNFHLEVADPVLHRTLKLNESAGHPPFTTAYDRTAPTVREASLQTKATRPPPAP